MNEFIPNYNPPKNFFLLGVKLILVNDKDEVLLLWRSEKISNPHTWDFPGGGVDTQESPDQAVIRELLEETGIAIKGARLFTSQFVTEGKHGAVILGYTANISEAEVALGWEHETFKWVPVSELHTIPLRELHSAIATNYIQQK